MADQLVVGVDVGTSKLCSTVALREQSGRTRYVGHGSTPADGLVGGRVTDPTALAASFDYALDEVRRLIGMPITDLVVSVSGARMNVFDRTGRLEANTGTPFSTADVMRALPDARSQDPDGWQTVHRVVRSLAIDGQPVDDPSGRLGRQLDVRIRDYAVPVELVEQLRNAVDRSGGRIHAIVPPGVASGTAALTDQERRQGVLLIDIGSAATDLAFYVGGELWDLASLTMGGHHITMDIATLLDVSFEEAERLKIRHGAADLLAAGFGDEPMEWGARAIARIQRLAREGRVPAEVVQAVAGARLLQLLRRIDELVDVSQVRNSMQAGVVMTGGTANVIGIEDIAASVLQMPVRAGGVVAADGFPAIPDPSVSASVGLVRYAVSRAVGNESARRLESPDAPERLRRVAGAAYDAAHDAPGNVASMFRARREPAERRGKSANRGFGNWLREFIPSRADDE